MQINNKEDNSIIRILRLRFPENSIVYQILDVTGSSISAGVFEPETQIGSFLDQFCNTNEECLKLLQTGRFSESHFVISEDEQNWNHDSMMMRLLVPSSLIISSLRDQDALSTIINRKISENTEAEEKFVFACGNWIIVYVNTVAQEDGIIVQPYIQSGQILIQTKNQ